jgi:hypothetical protein
MSAKWEFRLAKPEDAEAFSRWAATNPHIEQKDLLAGMQKNNPTVLTFTVTKDEVPVIFAPVYLSATLAHLGLNPETEGTDKLRGLQMLLDGVAALMAQVGVREIITLSKKEYGVAKWALAHEFEQEERELFKFKIIKEAEEQCAPVAVK